MTPYSIITVFQIGLLLLVMRLISQSLFFIIITNHAGARFTVSRKLYFPSDCGFFLSFLEIGIATLGPPSISRLVYIIMILYRLSREWRPPLSNIGL